MWSVLVILLPLVAATHYEDPAKGCGSDEQAIQVTGVSGDFCSPPCNGTTCPTDPPSASDAKPQCALKSSAGAQFCALVCTPGANAACPIGASCQSVQGTGLCTYPGAGPGPAPAPSPGKAGKWTVLSGQFSAVTIGIGFRNDKVGWTTQTTGSDLPTVVGTTDGGASWAPVAQTPATPLPMSLTAKKGSGAAGVVGVTGLAATEYSMDGQHFNRSIALVPVSQDIKYQNGHMTITSPSGPCVSTTNGIFYTCYKVPYKNDKTGEIGRYSSSPSANIIYHTAGTWPDDAKGARATSEYLEITKHLRMVSTSGGVRYEMGPKNRSGANDDPTANSTYIAELWKSSDGGKTWQNLISETGSFYFNDIHCFDDTHCVAVGEGFSEDSSSPGARVYVTNDGETFKEVHRESTTGQESLMTAKMLSTTEHWAGGTTKSGGITAPLLALHSTNAGGNYTNEYNNVLGQMITSMDFISSEHGYATTVNALQISSLLQYGVAPASETMQLTLNHAVMV